MMSPLADHLLHFPPPQVEAKDLTEQLKRIRDTTCLFRAYAAYFTRNLQTHQHWVDGARDSADYASNRQHLSNLDWATNYACVFPSDCKVVTDRTDHRAPGKLASRLEVLAKRLSPAERKALAPQLSAAALAYATTGEAAMSHTTGDCAACNVLRQKLPQTLRAAGLPRARKDLPAELGTTASDMAGARHGQSRVLHAYHYQWSLVLRHF